jgi:hypothetical protein
MREYKDGRFQIKDRLAAFDALLTESLLKYPVDNTTEIKDTIARARRSIVVLALDNDFVNRHDVEVNGFDTAEQGLELLDSCFISLTPEEVQKKAREKLEGLTRNVEISQTFERFYVIMTNIAKEAHSEELVRSFLVKSCWERNLSPEHKDFLNIFEKSDLNILDQAKYLDEKKRNISQVSTNATEAFDSRVQTTIRDSVDAASAAVEEKYLSIIKGKDQQISRCEKQLADLSLAVYKIQAVVERQSSFPIPTQTPQVYNSGYNNSGYNNSGYGNSGFNNSVKFCYSCGFPGHHRNQCQGTNVKCHFCQKIGHIQRVCPVKRSHQSGTVVANQSPNMGQTDPGAKIEKQTPASKN